MWRAWDGIRALDYLMSRKEVDVRHLGITGNSGGGTMTTWLCGVEQRWTMAAPSCFVTEFRRNMENELGADMEQCPPKALALGLDHEDFLAALAPKPIIILAKEKDYFDARGNEAAYHRLKRLYRLLGAEDNIAYFVGPTYHGYSQENREAMYRWFNRCTGISDAKTEPKLVMEKEETLWCTPHGQVAELQSKPIYSFTQEKSRSLAAKRLDLDGAALPQTVAEALRLPERTERSGIPHPAAAARPEVSAEARTSIHGGNRPGCARDCLQAHHGAAALASATRHQQGDPVRLARIRRRRACAVNGSFEISSRPNRKPRSMRATCAASESPNRKRPA